MYCTGIDMEGRTQLSDPSELSESPCPGYPGKPSVKIDVLPEWVANGFGEITHQTGHNVVLHAIIVKNVI